MFSKKLVDPNWFEASFRAKRPERATGESNGRGAENPVFRSNRHNTQGPQ